jgi:hypothetical protein
MHKILRSDDSLNYLDRITVNMFQRNLGCSTLVEHHIFRFEEKSLLYEAVAETRSAHFPPPVRTGSEMHALAPVPADRDPSPHTQGAADRQVFCNPPLHLRAPSPLIASRSLLLRPYD